MAIYSQRFLQEIATVTLRFPFITTFCAGCIDLAAFARQLSVGAVLRESRIGCLAALALVCTLSLGCVPQSEKSVVLYSASDREYATPILDAFQRSNPGIEVARQFDIAASKTLGLVTRIERERERPKCDVFWNNEIIHTIRLQKQGLLASRRWKVPDAWPKAFKAKDGSWNQFAIPREGPLVVG